MRKHNGKDDDETEWFEYPRLIARLRFVGGRWVRVPLDDIEPAPTVH